MKNAEIVDLNGFRFDLRSGELTNPQNEPVHLRKQSCLVLQSLAMSRGKIVSKEDLIRAVWPDTYVTDDSLAQCIADIRRVLDDKSHSLVQTAPKKGYRLAAVQRSHETARLRVRALLALLCVATLAALLWRNFAPEDPVPTDRPRLAVLAFDDFSAGADKGYLSDAISEGLITELARFDEIAVMARTSSFRFRNSNQDISAIRDSLGVNYVLEGSQQKNGNALKIHAQLIDAASGEHIWAESFDRDLSDLFIVQEQIVRSVAWAVSKVVVTRPLPEADLPKVKAMHFFMQNRRINANPNREGIDKTIEQSVRAIDTDPDSIWGYLAAGWAYRHKAVHYAFGDQRETLLITAEGHAETAMEIDPNNYLVHYLRARLHQETGETEKAGERYRRAIELNPSAANVIVGSASPLLYAGRIDEAIERIEAALDIDPDHQGWFHWQMAWALWEKRQCQAALDSFGRMARIPKAAHRMLAATYSCLQRKDDASNALNVYLAENPDVNLKSEQQKNEKTWPNEASRQRWLKDMAYAGMPAE